MGARARTREREERGIQTEGARRTAAGRPRNGGGGDRAAAEETDRSGGGGARRLGQRTKTDASALAGGRRPLPFIGQGTFSPGLCPVLTNLWRQFRRHNLVFPFFPLYIVKCIIN